MTIAASLIAVAAALAAQAPGSESIPSQLPPLSGDPRATSRERDVAAPLPAPPPVTTPPSATAPALPPAPRPAVTGEPPPMQSSPPAPEAVPLPDGPVSSLPQPNRDPLRIDAEADPILQLARRSVPNAEFTALVGQAVDRSPRVDEAAAGITEAEAVREEAKERRWPTIDLGLNASTSFLRNFDADDLDVIVERSRHHLRPARDLTSRQGQGKWRRPVAGRLFFLLNRSRA